LSTILSEKFQKWIKAEVFPEVKVTANVTESDLKNGKPNEIRQKKFKEKE
jgi:prophage antirepressor-like protein